MEKNLQRGRPRQGEDARRAAEQRTKERKAQWQRDNRDKVREYQQRHAAKVRGESPLAAVKSLLPRLKELPDDKLLQLYDYLSALLDDIGEHDRKYYLNAITRADNERKRARKAFDAWVESEYAKRRNAEAAAAAGDPLDKVK